MHAQRNAVKASKAFVYLAVLEALSAIPLAFFLPFSKAALVSTVVILVALNAAALAAIAGRALPVLLQASNLAIGGIWLKFALGSGGPSWQASAVTIGALYLCLFAIGFFHLSDSMLRGCFAAQQLALASTLIFWIVIRHFGAGFEASGLISAEHFRAGLRFLFAGPLALVAVTFFAGLAGWRGYFAALAGVCAGQWAMGFFELGGALQAYPLVVAGFVLLAAFVLLLVLGAVSRHRPVVRGSR